MKRSDFEKCRDSRGFLDVEALDSSCKRTTLLASNAVYLYELEDCQVIFKRYSFEKDKLSHGAFNEVLYYRLARKYGIYCAEYDFGFFGKESGTISYIIEGNVKSIYELSRKKYSSFDMVRGAHLSYLELCELFDKKYKKYAPSLKKELLRLIVFDALLGHSDKSCTNLLLCEKENEVHLYSVDGSDLWGKFISLENRCRELYSFLNSLNASEREELISMIQAFDVNTEIDNLTKEYPSYREIAKSVKDSANRTRDAILQGENNEILKDYFLYPKREIKILKGGKIK